MTQTLPRMQRLSARPGYGAWLFAIVSICSMMLALCCMATAFVGRAYAVAEDFAYDGDALWFMTADGGRLGMYEAQDGSWYRYQDGEIVVFHITNNGTIFCGFYLDADYKDQSTRDESLYIPASSYGGKKYGVLSFSLDIGYAGRAWPIALVKPNDPNYVSGSQYYLAVPELEKIPGYLCTVTFTDGQGNDLLVTEVVSGEDATPPPDPERKGYTFAGWDKPYIGITEDTTVNATWVREDGSYYFVTFKDGWGKTIETQPVEAGEAAVAPADPTHEGYTFIGWDKDFSNVTEDMEITAEWLSNDEATLEAVKAAIAALPTDPAALLDDTANEGVAKAAAAYNALSDELKDQLSDAERLHLAKCAIAVLPSDAFDVTAAHKGVISAAQAVVASLSEDAQASLDDENVLSNRSYGRYLENAVWALDGLSAVNNSTLLKAGTYTGQVKSTSSLGKSKSRRGLTFTVKSVTVKNGLATAIVEHSSNSSQTLRLGGKDYKNLQTDPAGNSYFEIPIRLNSTFHFSVKGKNPTDETDAITYEMTVTADESTMKPDPKKSSGDDDFGKKKPEDKKPGGKSNPTGNGGSLTPTGTTPASNAGNLSSLLKTSSSTQNSSSSASKSSGSSDGKPSGDSDDEASVREVIAPADGGASGEEPVDLAPAVAGGSLLSASLGVLGFALQFVRREFIFLLG